jgi:hypothetical protein
MNPTEKQQFNRQVREYKKNMKGILVTTRFNNETWAENQRFLKQYSKVGCIYPSPETNSRDIIDGAYMFVLEMNNEQNRIMGIGLVKNHPIYNKYKVYSNQNYNRFTYIGKVRIDRSVMDDMEEKIMKVFDILCFKGSRHMKRLQGIKSFPPDILYKCKSIMDLPQFISEMFKKRLKEDTN